MSKATAFDTPSMTMGYFRIILRCFGDTATRRAMLLEGTGVTEATLEEPSARIDLFQQLRQVDNLNAMFGEGWVATAPDLWNSSSHGALGVAALTAADLAGAIDIIVRFQQARAPFNRLRLRRHPVATTIEYTASVELEEPQWRPVIEIAFLGLRSVMSAVLGRPPAEARYSFACAAPPHAADIRDLLGGDAVYDGRTNSVRIPAAYLAVRSSLADATLHGHAVGELERARRSLFEPAGIRGRVEHLLATMPPGRFGADEMARLLGVSRRTLVRRLADAGVRYRELLDAELKLRAGRLLDAGVLAHAEIAEQLGYADPTSFSRACRRWFGGRA